MLKLHKSPEVSLVEHIIIENILRIFERRDELVKQILTNAMLDQKKVMEASSELSFINAYQSPLKSLKDQLWQYATPSVLLKIAEQSKFKNEYSYSEDFTLPLEMLPKFSSYDKVVNTDPKAMVAKKLGATITM